MNTFPWLIINSDNDEEVAGFQSRELALTTANSMGEKFVVEENTLVDISGEMVVTQTGVTIGYDHVHVRILDYLDVKLSRGTSHNLGYVRLVIKPEEKPEGPEEKD